MYPIDLEVKNLNGLPKEYKNILLDLINQARLKLEGKREVMFPDIINLILRKGYSGEKYTDLIIWCNSNIKNGKYVIDLTFNP